jgi:signal transduction histidine kinase/CheY-like chemotaxis protein
MADVLVVDDRPVNRDLVRTLLGYHGHQVREATSGADALRAIHDDLPDLVITDVLMPGMDGYGLIRQLRSDPATSDIAVIFYTAHYLEAEAQPIAAACGVHHVVVKSGDPATLLAAVDSALRAAPDATPRVVLEDFSEKHLQVLSDKLLEKVRELEEKDRLQQLVDAVLEIGGDLSVPATLRRVVTEAQSLLDARYAALAVLGPNRTFVDFVHAGLDSAVVDKIGRLPSGCGVLRLATARAGAVRLTDIRAHPSAVGFPLHHPPMSRFLGVPILVNNAPFATLYVAERNDGAEFTVEDERLAGALAAAAALAVSNARHYEDSRQREAWLGASADITATLQASESAEALQLVAVCARRVAGARVALIEVPGDDGTVVMRAYDGPHADNVPRDMLLMDAPICREVTTTGAAVIIADARRDDRACRSPVLADAAIGPLMAVPLVVGGRALGALLIGNAPDKKAFSPVQVEMATAFAGYAALTVEFARAQADRRLLSLYEDRDGIARSLHDVVIQRLLAVGLRLQGLHQKMPGDGAGVLKDSVAELDRTVRDIRNTIFALQAPAAHTPLRGRIVDVVIRYAEDLGFEPHLRMDGPLDHAVPDHLHPHLLATLGEALANVARHASATSVEVVVDATGDHVVVRVTDNGRGLPPQRKESGLATLRARAGQLGGTLRTGPGPDGRGLAITWRVPSDANPPPRGPRPAPRSRP